MRFERLSLKHFRNLATVELVPQASTLVLRGQNGQGKTNLLEALYLCATGRSFRQARSCDLLAYNTPQAQCRAIFSRHDVRHEIFIQLSAKSRSVRVDGRHMPLSTKLLELVNIVAFFPDDLRIAKGAPEERRRFFDRAVANYEGDFANAALDYQRVLKSRNALLRAPIAPDRSVLAVYDQKLVELGQVLHRCRSQVLQKLLPIAQKHFAMMLPALALDIELETGLSVPCISPEGFAEAFTKALQQSYPRDRARGTTCVGPHRADLRCRLNGRDVRQFASQGQQRCLILALKLAEVVALTEKLGTAPILLLDDVSSELDAARTRHLFEVIQPLQSQVWISTTGAVDLPIVGPMQWIDVQDGSLCVGTSQTLSWPKLHGNRLTTTPVTQAS